MLRTSNETIAVDAFLLSCMAPGVALYGPTACIRHNVSRAPHRAGATPFLMHSLKPDVRMCLAGETRLSKTSVPRRARVNELMCLRIANKLRELLRSCWAPCEDIQCPIASSSRQPDGWDIRLARESLSCGAAASPAIAPAGATPGPGHSETPHRPRRHAACLALEGSAPPRVGRRAGADVLLLRPGQRRQSLPAAAVCGPLALV